MAPGTTRYTTVRRLDQLAEVSLPCLRHVTAGVRKILRLSQAADDALDDLLRIDRRREADILSDRAELIDSLLRPAERQAYEARGRRSTRRS